MGTNKQNPRTSSSSKVTPVSPAILFATVFIAGAAVMVFELLGSRVMAPYLGSSIYTWTSLIGVIMAALSAGYFCGGVWADKSSEGKKLSTIFLSAALCIAAAALVKDGVLMFFIKLRWPVEVSSIVGALALFLLPSFFLGMITPFAARLALKDVTKGGATYGKISGLSTLGSIVGTFAAGYWIIPSFGTTQSLFALSAVLFVLSLVWWPWRKTAIAGIVFAWVTSWAVQNIALDKQEQYGFYDIDTPYQRVLVYFAQIEGAVQRVFHSDPFAAYSVFDPKNPDRLSSAYIQMFDKVRQQLQVKDLIVVGGAGYVYPTYLVRNFPDLKVDTVEIDPAMWPLAKKLFGASENDRLTINHADARMYFRDCAAAKYDMVVYDIFNGVFVPFHTTTLEAFTDIKRTLRPDGTLIMNAVDGKLGHSRQFIGSLKATVQKLFKYVEVYEVRYFKNDNSFTNFCVVAADKPVTVLSQPEVVLGQDAVIMPWDGAGATPADTFVLRDNFAPVEKQIFHAL